MHHGSSIFIPVTANLSSTSQLYQGSQDFWTRKSLKDSNSCISKRQQAKCFTRFIFWTMFRQTVSIITKKFPLWCFHTLSNIEKKWGGGSTEMQPQSRCPPSEGTIPRESRLMEKAQKIGRWCGKTQGKCRDAPLTRDSRKVTFIYFAD